MKRVNKSGHYFLMLLPGMVVLFIFVIIPMFMQVIAFQDYSPAKGILGSSWIGLDHFKQMLQIPDSKRVFFNTIFIASGKIILNFVVSVVFALLLNEVRIKSYKKTIQTIVYIPFFLSWVVLASVFKTVFDVNGIINNFLEVLGFDRVMFLGSNFWFRPIIIGTEVWKGFGFWTVIYLAAITGISPHLYEAASIDGASRFQRMIHITLPGITSSMILMLTLSLGSILNGGFEQIFNLYNPIVYKTGDIIDTYVYRIGLVQFQYGFATAVGVLKSVVSFILIIISYKMAEKFANYRIF